VRSGARSLHMNYEGQRVTAVSFDLATPAGIVAYKLPLRIDPVFERLQQARPPENRARSAERDRAQAERTAWRLLVWWLKAQFGIIDMGMVENSEVFTPYMLGAHGLTLYEGQIRPKMLSEAKEKP